MKLKDIAASIDTGGHGSGGGHLDYKTARRILALTDAVATWNGIGDPKEAAMAVHRAYDAMVEAGDITEPLRNDPRNDSAKI